MFESIIKSIKNYNIQINGKKAINYALKGEMARLSEDWGQAVKYMNMAINLEPDNDMFYLTRAIIYKNLKNKQAALKDIDKVLELNNSLYLANKVKKEILSL